MMAYSNDIYQVVIGVVTGANAIVHSVGLGGGMYLFLIACETQDSGVELLRETEGERERERERGREGGGKEEGGGGGGGEEREGASEKVW